MVNVWYEPAARSWSRTTFFIVLFSVFLFFPLLFASTGLSSPLRVFSSPVLSAYWWEILAGAREISEMKGAVKNAINCKLIFEIKADRGRPPRRPGCSRRLIRSWIRIKCVRWRVKRCAHFSPFVFFVSPVLYYYGNEFFQVVFPFGQTILFPFDDANSIIDDKLELSLN